jgi:hypothetical protein
VPPATALRHQGIPESRGSLANPTQNLIKTRGSSRSFANGSAKKKKSSRLGAEK